MALCFVTKSQKMSTFLAVLISLLCHVLLIIILFNPKNYRKKFHSVEIRLSSLQRTDANIAIQPKNSVHHASFPKTNTSPSIQKPSGSPRYAQDNETKNVGTITLPPPPNYPKLAQSMGIDGDVKLRVTTDENGQIQHLILVEKLGYGLDECALEWSKQFPFPPNTTTEAIVRFVLD